jgi:hypothetical protein
VIGRIRPCWSEKLRFGWTKAEAMDMGAMGVYQLSAVDQAGARSLQADNTS